MALKRATRCINSGFVSHDFNWYNYKLSKQTFAVSCISRRNRPKMPASHTDCYDGDTNGDSRCEQMRRLSGSSRSGTSKEYLNGNNNSNIKLGSSSKDLSTKRKHGDEFINEAVPRLLNKVLATYKDRDSPVVEFVQPEVLKSLINFKLDDEPLSNQELEALLEKSIKYFVKTGHPYFYNQLFTGVDTFALSGALLTEALNCSAYTYEIGPVHTLIEDEIIKKIGLEFVGYKQVDGIFAPGGSVANMYGLSLARHKFYPQSKSCGVSGMPPVHIYTSALSHYSIKKAAFFLGFGLDNVISVETDSKGRMIPERLDEAIQQSKEKGFTPMFVNATAGTTVFGAYDPIDRIADVCKKHNVWLHVDSCWGGAVLLSDKLRAKMRGIEKADSLAWDPHKMAGSILQCAVIVTKHPGLLAEAHCTNATYLFQQDKVYDVSYDTGDKSVQCGRKIDAFKFWVQWKAYGNTGMAERIEACFDNALYLRDLVRETEGFRLVVEEPECTNVCFWYIPERLRGQPETEQWWSEIAKVAPKIKGRMQMTGSMMVGYQPQDNLVNFFRMICSNPASTREDMKHLLDVIVKFGEEK